MISTENFNKAKAFIEKTYNCTIASTSAYDDEAFSTYTSDLGVDCSYTLIMDLGDHFGVGECIDGSEIGENATVNEVMTMIYHALKQNEEFKAMFG